QQGKVSVPAAAAVHADGAHAAHPQRETRRMKFLHLQAVQSHSVAVPVQHRVHRRAAGPRRIQLGQQSGEILRPLACAERPACKGGQRLQLLRPCLFQMGHVHPSFLPGLPSSPQGGRLLRQAVWDAARLNTGQPISASTRFSNSATSTVLPVRRDSSAAKAITWLCTDWAMGLVLGRSPFRMETNSSIMPSPPPEWPVLPGWTVYTARFPVITPGPNQV